MIIKISNRKKQDTDDGFSEKKIVINVYLPSRCDTRETPNYIIHCNMLISAL